MSPYEISHPGGSIEHFNEQAGSVWMQRMVNTYPSAVWLKPLGEQYWGYSQSIGLIRALMQDRMYPLTLSRLEEAMRRTEEHKSGGQSLIRTRCAVYSLTKNK